MPVIEVWHPKVLNKKTDKKGKHIREIDSRKLIAILDSIEGNREETTVFFEQCPFHADKALTMRSMAMSAGKILAILEAKNFKVVRILSYDWQPEILGKVPRGKTKEYAEAAAKIIWPMESFLESKNHKVPNTGFIDAALIAEYGRRQLFPSSLAGECQTQRKPSAADLKSFTGVTDPAAEYQQDLPNF